ncbi:MAG TPA: 5'-methylthioadenosine nucleosidase [Herbaspirillum sp.]|jgi:adenosylhomocysteine nucleosidase
MPQKILLLTALESELKASRAPVGVEVVFTGVGKVNAASVAVEAILRLRPDLVVNFGTAGKIRPALHGLLEIAKVIQRDMLAMPLAERGVTPFSDAPAAYFSGWGDTVCGTGDSFVTARDEWLAAAGVDVVDMELFAIAHACRLHAAPWRAYKYITDDADDASHQDWTANVHLGETLFWERLSKDCGG